MSYVLSLQNMYPFRDIFTIVEKRQFLYSMLNFGDTKSPFHSQLTILKNTINNWHTLSDNISNQRAETLSQTGVSCSYVLCVIIAKYVPIQRHFYDSRKTAIFV